MKDENGLTPKQALFVQHYCGECKGNATQAAIKAGYSPKSAFIIANENIRKPYIAQAIKHKMSEISDKFDVTIEEIAKELSIIAFSPDNPKMVRLKALELLGKYKAMFTEKVEQTGEGLTINVTGRSDKDVTGDIEDNQYPKIHKTISSIASG